MGLLDTVTTGVEVKPIRMTLYGVEKIGKTTFASQFPGALFVAAEDGTSHLNTARFVPSLDPAKGTQFNQILTVCKELHDVGPSTEPGGYQTIVFDSIDWIERAAAQQVCIENNVSSLEDIGYGKWKKMLIEKMETFLAPVGWCNWLYRRGFNIVFIGHTLVKPFKNPEGEDYDRYKVKADREDIAMMIMEWTDFIAFMNYDLHFKSIQSGMAQTKVAESNNNRILHLQRSAAFDAGSRIPMPKQINLGTTPEGMFDKFNAEYLKATQAGSQPAAVATA